MRFFISAVILLSTAALWSSQATNLRGGEIPSEEQFRDLTSWDNVCALMDKETWMAMAAHLPGLSTTDAEAFYDDCVTATQGSNETRTDVFTTNCHGQTAVMLWKSFMVDNGGTGMGCESELDCLNTTQICFFEYNESSCEKIPGDGKKPMCGAPKPSNNTNVAT